MAYYVNQYRQAFPTQFSVPTINTRGQAAVDAYNAGKADYENFAAHDAEMARAGYEADQRRLAAQDAWNAQQNAAVANNQASNAGVVAIQQEIAQNEAEISKLKTELSQLTAQYGDADAMDRMLAANRARIGDMGNSLAHQQAINNRFQFQWANKDKVKNQAKALEKDIVDAYREYAYAEDLKSKQVAAYNIKTKLDEYKEVTGKDYAGNPFANVPTGIPGVDAEVTTFDDALKMLNGNMVNGHPSEAAKKSFLDKVRNVPMTSAQAEQFAKIKDMKTAEEINRKNTALANRQKAAVDSFTINPKQMINKKSETFNASNGEPVTVKRLNAPEGADYTLYEKSSGKSKKRVRVYKDGRQEVE